MKTTCLLTRLLSQKSGCETLSSGAGQCMFDLSCRLSYGHKVGDCEGGFYQVRYSKEEGAVLTPLSLMSGVLCAAGAASPVSQTAEVAGVQFSQ